MTSDAHHLDEQDMSDGQDIVVSVLESAHRETVASTGGRADAVLDWVALVGIIFEFISGCLSDRAVKRHVKRNSLIVRYQLRKALRAGNYPGDVSEMAEACGRKFSKLSDGEMNAVIEEAIDSTPTPPSPVGPWPFVVAIACMLSSTAVDAGPWMIMESARHQSARSSPWPDVHDPVVAESKITSKPIKTGTCACQGYKRAQCYCLKKGVRCSCHVTKGSVWELDELGEPLAKVPGQYADPRGKVGSPSGPGMSAVGRWVLQTRCVNGRCVSQWTWQAR